jgi:hypothetical protein
MQKGLREKGFGDRLGDAARARQVQLERARAKSPANDPEFPARQEARRQAKLAALEREAEDKKAAEAARLVELMAEAAAREAEKVEQARRAAEREAEQKAARDAR